VIILALKSDTSVRQFSGETAVSAETKRGTRLDVRQELSRKGKRRSSLIRMPSEQPGNHGKHPTNEEKEPQLSADEAREILRTLKPMPPEDRLPPGTTIIRFISSQGPRKRR
jgi:hypothetical protein